MEGPPDNQRSAHLGLQAKVVLTIVVTLCLTTIGITIANYYQESNIQRQAIDIEMVRLENTLLNIADRSGTYLERIGSQLNPSHRGEDKQHYAIEPSLFSGIDSINLTGGSGEQLLSWSLPGQEDLLPASHVKEMAKQVLEDGRPAHHIHCEKQCIHSSFVPQIDTEGHEIVINANQSLANLLQDFKLITGADVSFFRELGRDPATRHMIPPLASTDLEKTQQLLEDALSEVELNYIQNFYLGKIGDGFFAVKRIMLRPPASFGSVELLLFSDQTAAQQRIQQRFQRELTYAGITILIASTLLVAALQLPISRILRVSNALPKLARQEYEAIRKEVRIERKNKFFRDEIDNLADAVVETTNSLQGLHEELKERRQQLEIYVQDLEEAQSFNQALLDGSPLAVIAYNENGKLRSINRYARELSGIAEGEEENINIKQLILPDEAERSIQQIIVPLRTRRERQVQSEQPLYSKTGKSRILTWLHARLQFHHEYCYLSVGLDITERRDTEEQMRWLSRHDHITGLLNRTSFALEAEKILTASSAEDQIALLQFDVNKFSALNDRYGLRTGDLILAQTAKHIAEHMPKSSVIGRTGGNEFAVLIDGYCSELDLQGTTQFRLMLEDGAQEIQMTGVCLHYPEHGKDIEEMLANATDALERAKESNPGEVSHIRDTDERRNLRQEKQQIRDQLLNAFDQNRFVLFYQPIYDVLSNSVSHCECLIRLFGDDGRFVPPGVFLGVAKEFGLMPQLDKHVIRMALEQQARWTERGRKIKLSVNVTPATFQTENFHRFLTETIEQTGANAEQLIFEIVETEAIERMADAQAMIEELKSIGAELAFDDFGIGFTSFEYLRELPVDYVKIDQSFIRYLDQREQDQLLVKSMIDMSLALGKKVIAEGVETRETFDLLKDMGLHYLQGYYIAHPAPESELDFGLRID